MNTDFCSPRYNWGLCGNLSIYYYVVFSLYSILLVIYAISLIVNLCKKGLKHNLKFRMRMSIIIYCVFGCLHTISNFYPTSVMSALFTEICLSMTFLFIMVAILHLIEHWIKLSLIINNKANLTNKESLFERDFGSKLVLSMSITGGVCAIIIDVIMIYIPEYEQIMHTVHLSLWGALTTVLGILVATRGSRIVRHLRKTDVKSDTFIVAYQKFRFLWYTYAIAGIGYGCLYGVGIGITVWHYSLTSWYVMYSLFHFAIIATGFGMIIIFKKRILSNKIETTSTPKATTTIL